MDVSFLLVVLRQFLCLTQLTWTTVQLDIDGDFGFYNDIQGAVNVADVAPGDYTVYYNVTDECGNFTAQSVVVNVSDCKLPTPYCVNGVIFEIMQTGMVEVWASDLDAGSFDNCTATADLKVYFNNTPGMTNYAFDCSQVGPNNLELWIEDEAGNKDFCQVTVFVQDNMGHCGDAAIAGTIATENNESVEAVDVELNGGMDNMASTVNGEYNFDQLPTGGDYSVTPTLDTDYLNGVTTYDLVLISKHILGVSPFDTPYKHIAADANNSGTVTTYDMVVLRRLILMIDTELTNNTSWRFVDAAYAFPNASNPWAETFPEVINYNNLDQAMNNANFVAVKVGDINGSAVANSSASNVDERTYGTLVFSAEDREVKAGNNYTVDFTANDFNALGYQFTMNFSGLELVDVVDGVASAENFGLEMAEAGVITTSWNTDVAKELANEVLFSVVFTATVDAQLSELMTVNSDYTKAEAYGANGELMDVNFEFTGATVAGYELFQSTPNPSNGNTTIGFSLPVAAPATITVQDVAGKTLKVITSDFAKGYNTVRIENIEATGVLYYTLTSADFSATKKMVVVK